MPSASTLAAGEAPGPQEKAPRRDGMDATRGNRRAAQGRKDSCAPSNQPQSAPGVPAVIDIVARLDHRRNQLAGCGIGNKQVTDGVQTPDARWFKKIPPPMREGKSVGASLPANSAGARDSAAAALVCRMLLKRVKGDVRAVLLEQSMSPLRGVANTILRSSATASCESLP